MTIKEELQLRKPFNWSDRLVLHVRYLGHLPINPRPVGSRKTKTGTKVVWRVECVICGKQYEDLT